MSPSLQIRVQGGDDLRRLTRQLRGLEDGKKVRAEMRRALKAVADDRMVPAVRAAALAIPSKRESARRGRRSLRRSIARATQTRVRMAGPRAGVLVWVNPKRMPPGQQNLPAYMEGLRPFQRWRKPLFGDTEHWYTQRPHPYFYRAVRPHEDDTARRMTRIIDGVADKIERG